VNTTTSVNAGVRASARHAKRVSSRTPDTIHLRSSGFRALPEAFDVPRASPGKTTCHSSSCTEQAGRVGGQGFPGRRTALSRMREGQSPDGLIGYS
jgi:hypothetical protein